MLQQRGSVEMLYCVVLEAGCKEDWIEEGGGEGSVEKFVEPPIARGHRTRGLSFA